MTPLPIRKKAWERAAERGFCTRVARRLCKTPQAIRKMCLPPEHKHRRPVVDPVLQSQLARCFDLQPNDFIWMPGEKAARKRATREAAEGAAQ